MEDSKEDFVSDSDGSSETARFELKVWSVSDGYGIICALYCCIGDLSLA